MSLLFVLWVLASTPITGCGVTRPCPTGQTVWKCTVMGTQCHMAYVSPYGFCASNESAAIAQANAQAIEHLKLQNQNLVGTTCMDTYVTYQVGNPPPGPDNEPSCVDGAGGAGGGGAGGSSGDGSFGDGVGGSSDVGGVGAVGASAAATTADVGAGPSGAGGFGEFKKGPRGAGGAW
jgi:hypothetical protein